MQFVLSFLQGETNEDPLMVLKGHRSIVNQIRYNPISHTIASSGVEKVIKVYVLCIVHMMDIHNIQV